MNSEMNIAATPQTVNKTKTTIFNILLFTHRLLETELAVKGIRSIPIYLTDLENYELDTNLSHFFTPSHSYVNKDTTWTSMVLG